jgi:multidrug efflux system outer membrane protein
VLRAAWEIDFWGKFRRGTESARAELAASEAGRDAIRASLIAEVARGYFALIAVDRRLEVAARTLEGRRKSFDLQNCASITGRFPSWSCARSNPTGREPRP